MATPAIPQNFLVQQGNGTVLCTWDVSAGAVNYTLQRSIDQVTYSDLITQSQTAYTDSNLFVGTQYFYQVAANNAVGTSAYSNPQSAIPTNTGDLSLAQVRLMAQQRADRVNSQFVTTPEWNTYINQSYFELYDLLVTVYEDYFLQTPYTFTTDGSQQYTLPTDFYKLLGVDCGLNTGSLGWVTLKKFDFISRNRYVFPNITSTPLGIFNMQYRLMGNTLFFIPTPSGGQTIRVWYVPKLTQLLQENSIMTGISGWTEYVIVDAAIKALQKEESDVTVLMMQKQALIKRIEDSAMNRDIGQPDTISNTRASGFSGYAGPGYDGSYGGF